MTAPTLERRTPTAMRPDAHAPSTGPVPVPTEEPRAPDAQLALAELALTAVTVAAVVGLARLFVDGSFLVPVLLFGIGGHGLAVLCRRLGWRSSVTTAVALVALVVGVSWFLLPETTLAGLPSGETLAVAREQLADALTTFRQVVAPAPVEPGFVLAAAIGIWVVAFTADTAAFRANAPVEAVVPATTLFVFAAALGAPAARLPVTAAFLASLLAHWLTQRVLRQGRAPTWMASAPASGAGPALRTGAALAALTVLAAVVVGPRVPGADDAAIIPWRATEREGPGARTTVSPLVDIRTRIVDQADVEVFRVRSEGESYWRLTSLEVFDGTIWRPQEKRYQPVDGPLQPAVTADRARSDVLRYEVEIGELDSIWLPVAFDPLAVEGTGFLYDADSSSLITRGETHTTEGQRYQVTSVVPDLERAQLEAVGEEVPADLAATYTALPEGFSLRVQQLAAELAGAPGLTPFARARALQDHFRDGSFTYDTAVGPGHDENALEAFLFETRTGYCEQYAGAYAALARAAGLPARVAVGFTQGERGDDGQFSVRGLHGHAWPEVYLAGYGWVAFEPTPGRGIPGAQDYTDIEPQQASEDDPLSATTLPPTTAPAPLPDTGPTTLPTLPPGLEADDAGAGADDGGVLAGSGGPLLAAAVLIGLPLLWLAALALAERTLRARRRSRARAGGPAARTRLAWAEASRAVARRDVVQHPWETPAEFARRATDDELADLRSPLGTLADAATAAAFGGDQAVGDHEASDAEERAASLERAVRDGANVRTRLRWAADPRPLLPRRRRRRDVREAETTRTPVGRVATPPS